MKKYQYMYIVALILYVFVNLLSINTFPFVHSDEVWLAGLSKTIVEHRSFVVTEPFFILFPRQPHAIKSLFHLTQGLWMEVWGYSHTSVRLLSLTLGIVWILLMYTYFQKKVTRQSKVSNSLFAFLLVLVPASSVQFLYASHFGRQEIFIVLFMTLAYILLEKLIHTKTKNSAVKLVLALSLVTGIAIGFHPNSFLIATMAGALLIFDCVKNKRLLPTLTYVMTTGLAGAAAIYISTLWTRSFLSNYTTFGSSLGVSTSLAEKIRTFPLFLYKLYFQISATYFTPNIKLEMILFCLLFLLSLLLAGWWFVKYRRFSTDLISPILASLGLTAGLIIIGRYNATSIVFYLIFFPWLIYGLIYSGPNVQITKKHSYLLYAGLFILIGALGFNSAKALSAPVFETYTAYTKDLIQAMPELQNKRDIKILCNLNAGFAFEPDQFVDYRDLAYLQDKGLTVTDYLIQNEITYVCLPEEMDYIFRNQAKWDILYGPMDYYPQLLEVLDREFELVASLESPQYAMRIPVYNDGYPWRLRIYKKI